MFGGPFGRLCDECVTVLFNGQSRLGDEHGVGHVKVMSVRDRDVA
jgi:hypothetical protein